VDAAVEIMVVAQEAEQEKVVPIIQVDLARDRILFIHKALVLIVGHQTQM